MVVVVLGTNNHATLTSVVAVKFSAVRPLVFAVATSDGFVFIYDLKENLLLPVVALQASQSTTSLEEEKKRGASNAKSADVP